MERTYLLRVIEKHFFVLSKEEIAQKITEANFKLPDFLVEALQKQDPRLNAISNLSMVNTSFTNALIEVKGHILNQNEKNCLSDPMESEEIFDDTLLLISCYYHYSAIICMGAMVDFIRLVLTKKVLLT